MKKLFKYATGLLLTGVLSVVGVLDADAQRGGAHASSGGGGGGGGGGGLSVSRGGFGGGGGSIRPSFGVGYRSPFAYNYAFGLQNGFGYWGYPSLGFYMNALPFGYYPFYMGANMFYYADGTFYQPYDNGYVVAPPPVGAAVPGLPKGAKSIMIDGKQFFEYRGVYYKVVVNDKGDTVYVVAGKDGVLNTAKDDEGGDGAEVAVPQVGDIVTQLPQDTRVVTLNGRKYYISVDDIYYEAITADGKPAYRIASVPGN